jgi:Tfp pilus assembly PilM family ATPase
MFGKNYNFVCVCLSDETLRVAQISGKGQGARISRVFGVDVTGLSEADLSRKVQSALSSFNAKKSNVILVLPAGFVTTKNVEIPSVDPEEIRSIVQLQAGRYTPFSREEIQFSYLNLGVYKNTYTKVLLAIANKNTIRKQFALLEKAKVRVKKVCYGPEGVAAFYPLAASLKPVGIIDIGSHSTDFMIVRGAKAISSRNIPIGKIHLVNEGSTAQGALVDELGKTIESYKSEDIDELPEKYVVTTDDQQSQETVSLVGSKLGWNAVVSPYLEQIKSPGSLKKKIAGSFALFSFADLAAIAANAQIIQINLLPDEVEIQKAIEKQGKEVFKFSLLIVFILLMVAVSLGWRLYTRNSFFNKVVREYEDERVEVGRLEALSKKTQVVHAFLSNRMVGLDAIKELYRDMPNEIYITDVAMDDKGNLSVQGISKISSIIYKYRTSLKGSALFQSVNVKSQTAKKDRGEDAFAFDLAIVLKGFGQEEIDEKAEAEKQKQE